LREALNDLDESYVPITSRRFLFDAVQIAITAVPSLENSLLKSLIPKLKTTRNYIKKQDKQLLKEILMPIVSALSPKATTSITAPTSKSDDIEKLTEIFKQTTLNNQLKSDCFYSLTYNGVHSSLVQSFIASDAHSWSVYGSKIQVSGTKTEQEFKTSFQEQWNKTPLSKEFPASEVIPLINYN